MSLTICLVKKHSEEAKKNISDRLSKHRNGVGISHLKNNLIKNFKNNVKLAKYLDISKVTVDKYLNSCWLVKHKPCL